MRRKTNRRQDVAERTIKDIRCQARTRCSAEEKNRIVLMAFWEKRIETEAMVHSGTPAVSRNGNVCALCFPVNQGRLSAHCTGSM